METRNVNNDILSSETYESTEKLREAFDTALEDEAVKTIKVTKDIPMTESRRRTVEKKLRRTLLKAAELEQEILNG